MEKFVMKYQAIIIILTWQCDFSARIFERAKIARWSY